jgi:hypothetical protein
MEEIAQIAHLEIRPRFPTNFRAPSIRLFSGEWVGNHDTQSAGFTRTGEQPCHPEHQNKPVTLSIKMSLSS